MFEQQSCMSGNNQTPNPQLSDQSHQVVLKKMLCYLVKKVKIVKAKINHCPAIKNHSAVFYNGNIYIFGGYDSKKNHNQLHIFNIQTQEWRNQPTYGKEPEGRNGHTATVVENRMFVIGGWLGSGTYASSDVYILDLEKLNWSQASTGGEVPGPCNMHSADLIGKMIYIFRGGDGRDYLNDLHSLNTETSTWKLVMADGECCPPPRANHSSAVVKNRLYIFGGWDGIKRLNDLYCFDSDNNLWYEVRANSPPSARAGMCMATLNDKIYMFGGSGPQATCYYDLQIYDTFKNQWGVAEISDDEGAVRARAGHSMTAVQDRIYIFGGSCGQVYYKDFFIIETDAPPEIKGYQQEQTQTRLMSSLKNYYNNPQFSDISFIVQGQRFYGHKIILSQLCERLSVTFQSDMMESNTESIPVPQTSVEVFSSMLWFLYTGEFNHSPQIKTPQRPSIQFLLELMQLADSFMIDEIKIECEKQIQTMIGPDNFAQICQWSERCNAVQLRTYCEWYQSHIRKINTQKI